MFTAPPRNVLEIQVFGLQRSGNHGIIDWLIRQFDHPVTFLNNIRHFGDPFRESRDAGMTNTVPIPHGYPRRMRKVRESHREVLILSYENLRLRSLAREPLLPDHDALVGRSGRILRCLILRDFPNWIASRVRLTELVHPGVVWERQSPGNLITPWIAYAEEYVGQTAYLGPDVLRIDFPRWTRDEGYRAGLLQTAGIALRDNSNDAAPSMGFISGSSFGTVGPTRGQTDHRWPMLKEPRYAPILEAIRVARDRIEPLNRAAFGLDWPFDD